MKSTTKTNELREFHRFLSEMLKNGGAQMTPEEALGEWRGQHGESIEFEDDADAIQEALDEMANGDQGRPADQLIASLRRRIESKKR